MREILQLALIANLSHSSALLSGFTSSYDIEALRDGGKGKWLFGCCCCYVCVFFFNYLPFLFPILSHARLSESRRKTLLRCHTRLRDIVVVCLMGSAEYIIEISGITLNVMEFQRFARWKIFSCVRQSQWKSVNDDWKVMNLSRSAARLNLAQILNCFSHRQADVCLSWEVNYTNKESHFALPHTREQSEED